MHASAMAAAPAAHLLLPGNPGGGRPSAQASSGGYARVRDHRRRPPREGAVARHRCAESRPTPCAKCQGRAGAHREPGPRASVSGWSDCVIARAPGKVVLSGAYAVLEGAPALVAAVDRYVVADSHREPDRLTAEVATALTQRTQQTHQTHQRTSASRAPWFDASALRDTSHDRKLGLGSSAAILVASLAALTTEEPGQSPGDDQDLAQRVFAPALSAHRIAQRGGSGIDVAASTFGGVLCFRQGAREGELPSHEQVKLPSGLHIRVWSSLVSASTADMLTARTGLARDRAKRSTSES